MTLLAQPLTLGLVTWLSWLSLGLKYTYAIPPEQAFPNGKSHLENIGGGWIPRHPQELSEKGNLDEGSYWYSLWQNPRNSYLVLQKLIGRNPDGKAIFQELDVVLVPELIDPSYGLISHSNNECRFPNDQIFRETKAILLARYNQDTATPVKAWIANLTPGQEKWTKPNASLIKNLVCFIEQP